MPTQTSKKVAPKKASTKTTTKKPLAKAKKTATAKKSAKSKKTTYALDLKKKVVKAIKDGMTHLEASKAYKVGVHSIPNWIKAHS